MAVHAWIFDYGPSQIVFTTTVLSFSGNWGRQNYLDNYAGGGFQVTIKNNTNQVASFTRGTKIRILNVDGFTIWSGKITTIDYNDYPGDTGLSTATLHCIDMISQSGKFTMKNMNYTAAQTCTQAAQTNALFPTAPQITSSTAGDSTASGTASAYNGTILNRLNTLNNTEKGLLSALSELVGFMARSQVSVYGTTVQLVRSTSNSARLTYTNIRRIGLGDNFMNQVTVNPETVAAQLYDNTASQTSYGISGYSVSTADSTTDQAAGLASWLGTMQGDPATLRFEIDFSDVSSNATAFTTYLVDTLYSLTPNVTIEYQAQGQSLQTVACITEGGTFSGTPSETNITVFLSPSTYYLYFVLNNYQYGILGGDGITYDQPEIVYDENGWIYNDANVEQGSRLGW